MIVLLEMGKIGQIQSKRTKYDVYYATEDPNKFDHIHLKIKGQDIAEFWFTRKKEFKEKKSGKNPRSLKQSEIHTLEKELKSKGFDKLVMKESIKVYGRSYRYPDN